MTNDYMSYMPSVLAAVGAGFQWLRAQRGISDVFVAVLGFLIAFAVWCLFANWDLLGSDWRMFVINGVVTLPGLVASLFGGTYIASNTTKAAVAAGANPAHAMVPLTDSKN